VLNAVVYCDCFETDIELNGEPYLVRFNVAVFSNVNNYRTHKVINKINLTALSGADTGPVPAAADNQSDLSTYTIAHKDANGNSNKMAEDAEDNFAKSVVFFIPTI